MLDASIVSQANRKAWNCAMPYHRKAMDAKWDKILLDKDSYFQSEPELSALLKLGIQGKAIVHLACNNGIELLSLKKMGAGYCTGFDICDEAIKDAILRSQRLNLPAHFEQCNVYDIPQHFDGRFDLVYITIGAMVWLSDLRGFYAVARRLLKPGGKLFIYEQHPFTEMLPWNLEEGTRPMIENNYFHEEPIKGEGSLDYYGNAEYDAPVTYEFTHSLSEIMTAILENGFYVSSFTEYEHDISNGFSWVQNSGFRLPLSYILTALKP